MFTKKKLSGVKEKSVNRVSESTSAHRQNDAEASNHHCQEGHPENPNRDLLNSAQRWQHVIRRPHVHRPNTGASYRPNQSSETFFSDRCDVVNAQQKDGMKILLVGDSNDGLKARLLHKFVGGDDLSNCWPNHPIGCDFRIKTVLTDGQMKKLLIWDLIWDLAVQEKFGSVSRSFYRGAEIVLVVFPVTDFNDSTESNIRGYIQEARRCCPEASLFLVTADKQPGAPLPDALNRICNEEKIRLLECSVENGDSVKEVFDTASRSVIQRPAQPIIQRQAPTMAVAEGEWDRRNRNRCIIQ